jgi:hypothetical protein
MDEETEKEPEKYEDLKIKQHSVQISFLTMNKSGYQLNVLKLFPYVEFSEQKPLWFKSKIQWRNNWITQD